MREAKLVAVGKLTAYEQKVIPGPASAVCLAGFFIALQKNLIKDGETVLINIGEGPAYLEQMIYTSHNVSNVEECAPHSIDDYRTQLWNDVLE